MNQFSTTQAATSQAATLKASVSQTLAARTPTISQGPKRLREVFISMFQLLLVFACLGLALIGCQPKDEKVSTRQQFGPRTNNAGVPANLAFEDRGLEYSRSMLAELNLIANLFESASTAGRAAVASQRTSNGQLELFPENTPETPPTTAATCRTTRLLPSPEGTIEILAEMKDCKSKDEVFQAQSFGREIAFGVLSSNRSRPFFQALRIQSKGVDTNLRPVANPKDSLRTRFFRFLDFRHVGTEGGLELYRFFYEAEGTYSLNLKPFTDEGTVKTKQSGILLVDAETGTVKGFRATEPTDKFSITVESERKCRSCASNSARQEFRASGIVSNFSMDLSKCLLPQGMVESRFTIRNLSERDKYLLDISAKFDSSESEVRDIAKGDSENRSKVTTTACSADKTPSVTEFYNGLLY